MYSYSPKWIRTCTRLSGFVLAFIRVDSYSYSPKLICTRTHSSGFVFVLAQVDSYSPKWICTRSHLSGFILVFTCVDSYSYSPRWICTRAYPSGFVLILAQVDLYSHTPKSDWYSYSYFEMQVNYSSVQVSYRFRAESVVLDIMPEWIVIVLVRCCTRSTNLLFSPFNGRLHYLM